MKSGIRNLFLIGIASFSIGIVASSAFAVNDSKQVDKLLVKDEAPKAAKDNFPADNDGYKERSRLSKEFFIEKDASNERTYVRCKPRVFNIYSR